MAETERNHKACPGHQGHEGETRRDFLYPTAGASAAVGVAAVHLAVHRQPQPGARHAGAVAPPKSIWRRCRSASASPSRGAASRSSSTTARPEEIKAAQEVDVATLRDPQPDAARVKKPEWLIIVGVCTHLGCIPLGHKTGDDRGALRRLVLPVPRLGLRHVGAYPAGAGAAQPGRAALRVHLRHRDQDRLGSAMASRHIRPAPRSDIEPRHPLDRLPAADRQACRARAQRISDAAQPELLVEFRLSRRDHAGHHDRHRRRAGDALHAECRRWPSIRSSASCATSIMDGCSATSI